MKNIILMTDSYKASHWKQYPPNTEYIYSYFEPRGGLYKNVLFFGLQYILKQYLVGQIVTLDYIEEAEKLFSAHFGNKDIFNKKGWLHIVQDHQGKLPVIIKAVAEGTVLSIRNVLFTVENTCPKCFWITTYLETILSQIWYPCTVATKSYHLKKILESFLQLTGDDPTTFKLHDFGYRGASSQESAGIGDAAHLVNFMGTDTIAGIQLLQNFYHADMPAFSVPAAEHSTITSWGKDSELFAYANMLDAFPKGMVAVVSDSYDIFNACANLWGEELRDQVRLREGVLIIRPDSGDPLEVLPRILEILADKFGYSTNVKGFKVLPPFLRIIQGDGVDEKTIPQILTTLMGNGWSVDNIAFGSGGGLLQNVTRDTMSFAYKCSNIVFDGQNRPVNKAPITDPGKTSKSGKLALIQTDGVFETVSSASLENDLLIPVFKDGELLIDYNIEQIRERTK